MKIIFQTLGLFFFGVCYIVTIYSVPHFALSHSNPFTIIGGLFVFGFGMIFMFPYLKFVSKHVLKIG